MATTTTPEVNWAQRSSASTPDKNVIYLTIVASDVPVNKAKIDLKPGYIEFTGASDTKKTTYHVKLEFFDEIDVSESKSHHSARDIAFILRKKNHKDEYWPRLTKGEQKLHFLKTDFDKWVDEDDQDAVDEGEGAGGMPDLGGMGTDGGFGGIDFSKLGGGGIPDMSGDDGDEDEDDEDMPDLDDGEEETSTSKPKIEEVK